MALDREALARAEAGEASLRIYRWDRPTVSLGRRQRPEDVAAFFPGLPTVARPTGGGAVLHGSDLTVALAVPLPLLEVRPRELRATYRRLVGPLAEALGACGLPCALAEEREGREEEGHADCFAAAGKMDLLHELIGEGSLRKKIGGCALAATRDAALLHASIPAQPLPTWLSIDDEIAERYSNPVWDAAHFPHALAAAWRAEAIAVDLRELDRNLDPWTRASAVLHQIVDPFGMNEIASSDALGEYDREATVFATGDPATIIGRREGSHDGLPTNSEELRALLRKMEGFSET